MPPGLDRDRDGAVQVGDQVERDVLRRATATGCSARPTCCSTRRRPAAEQAEQIGAQGLRVLLLGSSDLPVDDPDAPGTRHAGRAGGARAAGPARRPRHPGLLCRAEGLGQGHLRRQRGVGGRGGRLARAASGETMDARKLPDRPGRSWPTPSRSTPRSAGCGPTRSGRWCTRCSRAATRSR